MPTTKPEIAVRAIEAIQQSGVPFAILHSADMLWSEAVSDVDLVADISPTSLIHRCAEKWRDHRLFPVVVWPYDIGGTATVFLATTDAKDGVQLDIMFDPGGVGKHGLRTEPLMASAVESGGLPVIGEAERLIYLWKKRSLKKQANRLAQLQDIAAELPFADVALASISLTGSDATARELAGEPVVTRHTRRHGFRRARRLAGRLRNPIGFWAHSTSETLAASLRDRFSGFLIVSREGPRPISTARRMTWYYSDVLPTVVRPGVYLSHGASRGRHPSPWLTLSGQSVDDAAEELTTHMASRILS